MIDVKFILDQPDTQEIGEFIIGKIRITPDEDFSFESFWLRLKFERRGFLRVLQKEISSFKVASNQIFRKGQYYEFDFRLDPPKETISFIAKDLQILWFLETDFELTDDIINQIRTESLRKLQISKAMNVHKKFTVRRNLDVSNNNLLLRVPYQEGEMSLDELTSFGCIFILCIIFALCVFFSDNYEPSAAVLLSVITLIIGGYFVKEQFLGAGQLGKINFEISAKDDTHFEVKLMVEKNDHKINTVRLSYEVVEEVIDNRGSSPTKRTEQIYHWRKKNPQSLKFKMLKTEMSYPSRPVPATFEFEDCSIYYQLKAEFLMNNGITSIRHGKFRVLYDNLE